MSDTLADLASWLPSEFLTADDNKTLFPNNHNPHLYPYDFASSSSTESESDDDEIAGLTRRFTRSVSLQDRLNIPYPLEKRGFSGSLESTLNWTVSGPTIHPRSTPTTPFVRAGGDARDLIYAAAGQVARVKMRMNSINGDVFANRGLLGAPHPLGPPYSHHHHHNCAIRRGDVEEFIRQQQFRQRVAPAANINGGGRCGDGLPVGFRQSAWPPVPIENPRRQQPYNGFAVKPVHGGSGGGCGGPTSGFKKECAGTGVFLPRRYSNNPLESKRKAACSPANLPARVVQSFNQNMDPIIALPQPNVHAGFPPHYEMLMARRNAVTSAQQRRSTTNVGVHETQMGHPEIVLPQEWTY